MSFINISHITKTFKDAKKESGVRATLKNFIKREYKYIEAIKDNRGSKKYLSTGS